MESSARRLIAPKPQQHGFTYPRYLIIAKPTLAALSAANPCGRLCRCGRSRRLSRQHKKTFAAELHCTADCGQAMGNTHWVSHRQAAREAAVAGMKQTLTHSLGRSRQGKTAYSYPIHAPPLA
eukprot:GHVU01225961.1.p1 GENE.GHVU01225961.1~~GHVU01225961.1.p1  ORF type:complete len:123 (+),score=2.49 GHVU01225961.1:319-687(+)